MREHKALCDYEPLRQLVERVRAGDQQALAELFGAFDRLFRCRARRHIPKEIQSKLDSSDIVQQTYVRLPETNTHFLNGSLEEFKALVLTIVDHEAENARRRYQETAKRQVSREVPLEETTLANAQATWPPADTSAPLDQAIWHEELRISQQAKAELSAEDREIIRLHREEGYSFAQLGGRWGCTPDAARKRYQRACDRWFRSIDGPRASNGEKEPHAS
jgi:RNA polymerase sigma-70 factor (ECF subfamily)